MKDNKEGGGEKNKKSKKSALLRLLRQYFFVVVVFFVALILGLGSWLLIFPKYKDISVNKKVSGEAMNKLKVKLESNYEELFSYLEIYNEIDSELKERVDFMVPSSDEAGMVYTEIEDIVLSRGLVLTSMSVISEADEEEDSRNVNKRGHLKKDPESVNGVGLINVSMEIEGVGYLVLKELLKDFERNLRLIDIQSVVFSPDVSSVSLTGKMFFNRD